MESRYSPDCYIFVLIEFLLPQRLRPYRYYETRYIGITLGTQRA